MLNKYWFKFNIDKKLPPGIIMGCGITAYSLLDAKNILSEKVFGNEFFEISEVIENIDISTLDNGHVIPNMNSPDKRGVWFPLGYE